MEIVNCKSCKYVYIIEDGYDEVEESFINCWDCTKEMIDIVKFANHKNY